VRQIYPATSTEMVDRDVPTTVTYVGMPGLAMAVPMPAPGDEDTPPYGLLVRDAASSRDMTIITTDSPPDALLTRTVTGRITPRPYAAGAAARFAERGDDAANLDTGRVLLEVVPENDEPVSDVASVADLAAVPDNSLVRIRLVFDGESTATCVAEGGCPPRALAAGDGIFVQLAHDAGAAAPVLVQTAYPSSVIPGQWQGPQVRNGPELQAFVGTPGVQALAGWARILVQASIVNDPELIRDRLWLGPALFAVLALLLWLGGRVGYPYFRASVEGSRRWTSAPASASPAEPLPETMPIVVSGHALTAAGQRRHLDEEPAVIRPVASGSAGRVTASVELRDGAEIPLAAHDLGLLGRVERGEVVTMRRVQPALWAHWYGTDLRMTFESVTARDLAANVVERVGPPVRSTS
jgi:hypothetical protein